MWFVVVSEDDATLGIQIVIGVLDLREVRVNIFKDMELRVVDKSCGESCVALLDAPV